MGCNLVRNGSVNWELKVNASNSSWYSPFPVVIICWRALHACETANGVQRLLCESHFRRPAPSALLGLFGNILYLESEACRLKFKVLPGVEKDAPLWESSSIPKG